MVDNMLESYRLFEKLQEEAMKHGLILEFIEGRFVFRNGVSGKYSNGKVDKLVKESSMDVSNFSYESLLAMIQMWKFCQNHYSIVKQIDSLEKVP